MAFNPNDCIERFMRGESIKQIAVAGGEDERYIECIVRSVMVGMEMARPKCEHECEMEGYKDAIHSNSRI